MGITIIIHNYIALIFTVFLLNIHCRNRGILSCSGWLRAAPVSAPCRRGPEQKAQDAAAQRASQGRSETVTNAAN